MRTRLVVARIRDLDPSAKVIRQDGSHQKWRLTTGASIVVPIHYRATYTFDGRGWIVQFDEPDIATFGRSLAAAKAHARSLLAVWLEVDDLDAAGVGGAGPKGPDPAAGEAPRDPPRAGARAAIRRHGAAQSRPVHA